MRSYVSQIKGALRIQKLCCVAAGRFDNEFAMHLYVNGYIWKNKHQIKLKDTSRNDDISVDSLNNQVLIDIHVCILPSV